MARRIQIQLSRMIHQQAIVVVEVPDFMAKADIKREAYLAADDAAWEDDREYGCEEGEHQILGPSTEEVDIDLTEGSEVSNGEPAGRVCPHCNGFGLDPNAGVRLTAGVHDNRDCSVCLGECRIYSEEMDVSEQTLFVILDEDEALPGQLPPDQHIVFINGPTYFVSGGRVYYWRRLRNDFSHPAWA